MSLLPVEIAHLLAARAEEHRWLIDGLWAEEAVGIVGGEPKCCKSFLALDMAVAVASGTACGFRRCRSLIPGHADHRFRTIAITPEHDDAGFSIDFCLT
jgi:hypothetical protein